MSTRIHVFLAILGASFLTSTVLPFILPGVDAAPVIARATVNVQNGLDAQKLNAQFATMKKTDTCTSEYLSQRRGCLN
jgi:hypothetical protein